jgi:hypothetical protein
MFVGLKLLFWTVTALVCAGVSGVLGTDGVLGVEGDEGVPPDGPVVPPPPPQAVSEAMSDKAARCK